MGENHWATIIFKVIEDKQANGSFSVVPLRIVVGNLHNNADNADFYFETSEGDVYYNVEDCFYYKENREFYGFPIELRKLLSNQYNYKLQGGELNPLNNYLDNYLQAVRLLRYCLSFGTKDKKIVCSAYGFDALDQIFQIDFANNFDFIKILSLQTKNRSLNRREIISQMKEVVIAQDEQVEALVNAVVSNQRYSKFEGLKNNILIIGSTGTGKSLMCRTLAKILDIPIVIKDATKYSTTGYVGDSVVEMLRDLYIESGKNLQKAEQGIVVIDEFDKLGKNSVDPRDVRTTDVQQELLGLLENGEYSVEIEKGNKITINTKNITFILGGAFQSLINSNKNNNIIGFNREDSLIETKEKIDRETLASKGGIEEELLRRLPVIIQMNALKKEDLKRILTSSKISNLKVWQDAFLEVDGVELVCSDKAIDLIAANAEKTGGGASGLQAEVTRTLSEVKCAIMDGDVHNCEVTITEQTVEEPSNYLVKKRGSKHGLSSAYGGNN